MHQLIEQQINITETMEKKKEGKLVEKSTSGRTMVRSEPVGWVSHRVCNRLARVRCGELHCNQLRMTRIRNSICKRISVKLTRNK